MIRNIISLNVSLFVLLFIIGCRDTCNSKMGNTFNSITWQSFTYASASNRYIAGFSISVLNALPVEYYRTASQKPIDNQDIDSIAFPDINQMNIYIKKNAVPTTNEKKYFSLQMIFDDRKDYTNCVHSGGPDKYKINLSFTINHVDSTFIINNVYWSENIIKGGI